MGRKVGDRGKGRNNYMSQLNGRIFKADREKIDKIAKVNKCSTGDLVRYMVKRLIEEELKENAK